MLISPHCADAPGPTLHYEQQYRADIDGLRAVAVLAVVGYHAGFPALSAGFSGVDVFFVISGYLISGIILRGLRSERFSFGDFYARRAIRILPALGVVLAGVLATAWVTLYPSEIQALARHVLAGGLFVSNFVFWSEASYFDSPDKPLLHLWSLAVEEQFYLAFPIIVSLLWRRSLRVTWGLIALIGVSFIANLWAVRHGQASAAFFFPITRFWEILAGALLCNLEMGGLRESKLASGYRRQIREVVAWIGVAFFVATAITVDESTIWPGTRALLPVLGSVALIASGPNASVNRILLSRKLLVGIGLISYPLYLWHWPILVFARVLLGEQPSAASSAALIGMAAALSWATWRVVEVPIRRRRDKKRSALLLLPPALAVTLIAFVFARGFVAPRVGGEATVTAEAAKRDWQFPPGGGFASGSNTIVVQGIRGDTSNMIVVLGDSFAEQYWPRFLEVAASRPDNKAVRFATYGGCPPLPGVNRLGIAYHGGHYRCDEFYARALHLASRDNVTTVVFAAWWEHHLDGQRFIASLGEAATLTPGSRHTDIVFKRLEHDIEVLRHKNKKVFVILSNPTGGMFQPHQLVPARVPFTQSPPVLAIRKDRFEAARRIPKDRLATLAAATGAILIDPAQLLCGPESCSTSDSNGQPIYKDASHLRASYARKHATFIDQIFD